MIILLFWAFLDEAGLGLDLGLSGGWIATTIFLFLAFIALSVYAGISRNSLAIAAAFLLLIITVWVAQPWLWTTSAILFIGVWLLSLATGVSADIQVKPVIGILIILIAFSMYATGPGTQNVGSAFFGQWWPSVYNFGSQVFGPAWDALSQVTATFSTGISMIMNPVGFAQNMMNGTYSRDPLSGLSGAYGVEIEQMRTTPIYPYQSYSFIVKLKNKGAFDADNVRLSIETGNKLKTPIRELGFSSLTQSVSDMPMLDIRELFFESNGIGCRAINQYKLRERFISIKATLEYDYSIDSSISMEFMSNDEWNRRVKEGILITKAKKPATLSNAPVQLNMDTSEQPIREGTPFHIGLYLTSAQKGETELSDVVINLDIPAEFRDTGKYTISCNPESSTMNECSGKTDNSCWDYTMGGAHVNLKPYLIYCHITPKSKMNEPTRTFMVRASANYTFKKTDSTTTKIEFGGGCCSEDDCSGGQECSWTESMEAETPPRVGRCGAVETDTSVMPGEKGYCDMIEKSGQKCGLGMGDCDEFGGDECDESAMYSIKGASPTPLDCQSVSGWDTDVCCPVGVSDAQCKEAFNAWVNGEDLAGIIDAMENA